MHSITDWTLQLRYSVTLARVLDSNRKFVDAAMRYYDLSMTQNKQVRIFQSNLNKNKIKELSLISIPMLFEIRLYKMIYLSCMGKQLLVQY